MAMSSNGYTTASNWSTLGDLTKTTNSIQAKYPGGSAQVYALGSASAVDLSAFTKVKTLSTNGANEYDVSAIQSAYIVALCGRIDGTRCYWRVTLARSKTNVSASDVEYGTIYNEILTNETPQRDLFAIVFE